MRISSLFFGILISAFGLPLPAATKRQTRPMPTASLPIEPFSPEAEILDGDGLSQPSGKSFPAVSNEVRAPGDSRQELGAGIRVQLTPEGFGGQMRLVEYARPWLGISQTLRYFGNEKAEALFSRRYGLLVGIEMHPWRQARLSPFLELLGGAEHFARKPLAPDLEVFLGEATAGLELQLNRLASFRMQWVETFYAGLEEPLFVAQQAGDRSHGQLEIFFSMDWQTTL